MNEKQELSQRGDKAESDSANGRTQGNVYKQDGNIGLGHMSDGNIMGNVAGTYHDNRCQFINNSTTIVQQTLQPFTRELKVSFISDEHQYRGDLVFFQLQFLEETNLKQENVLVKLTITFGEAEEVFPVPRLFSSPKNVNVRFGIIRGELYLAFDKGSMPLSKRETLINSPCWKGEPSGEDKFPKWVFKPLEGQYILEGKLENKTLGIVDSPNNNCVKVFFKVGINRKDIAVTFLDNANENKKIKETKISAFLDFIKPKLEKYLSKVELRYDSIIDE